MAILLIFGLSGCASTQTIKVLSVPVEEVKLNPPTVRKLDLQDIKWYIVTPKNIEEVFEKLKDARKDVWDSRPTCSRQLEEFLHKNCTRYPAA